VTNRENAGALGDRQAEMADQTTVGERCPVLEAPAAPLVRALGWPESLTRWNAVQAPATSCAGRGAPEVRRRHGHLLRFRGALTSSKLPDEKG
jgi:hypothetical protein